VHAGAFGKFYLDGKTRTSSSRMHFTEVKLVLERNPQQLHHGHRNGPGVVWEIHKIKSWITTFAIDPVPDCRLKKPQTDVPGLVNQM